MNSTRQEGLFALALERPAEQRATFLEAVCGGDAALRARLEALLAAHQHAAGFQHDVGGGTTALDPIQTHLPASVARCLQPWALLLSPVGIRPG
jgi:hypothetical protein